MNVRFFIVACCALFAMPGAGSSHASPATLTLVNPYPATGAADIAGTVTMTRALRTMQTYATPSTTDALLRHVQRLLVSALAAEVAVVRNPRGGGTAAALAVAASDSAMLLFGGSGLTAGTTPPAMRGLQPVALVARVPVVLVMRNEAGVDGMARLLGQVQRSPLQIGTPGERTAGQWLMRQLQGERPGAISTVAFNGGNGALRGVLARQVLAAAAPLPAVLPYATGQRLRILAIAAADRHVLLPTVPTFAESGFAVARSAGWHGLFAAPAIQPAQIMRLRAALAVVLRGSDARDALAGLGYVAEFGDERTLQTALHEELRRSGDAVAALPVQRSISSGGFTALNILSRVRS
ncbi:MAG: tripartite tricarboxylate transporter substrate-binding protein [Burkholderiales bacterium]